MLRPKTHFEQVPLEIVRKIAEEKIQETTTEQAQRTKIRFRSRGQKSGKIWQR